MDFPSKDELLVRYQEYSDEQILAILKRPKDYQRDAVEVAHSVALQRGLDLAILQSHAKATKTPALFPSITTPEATRKLLKSIQRILYLVALIPLLTGALSFTDGYPSLAFAYGVLAVIWGALAFLSLKRRRHQMVLLLFLLVIFMVVLRYMTAGLPVQFGALDWTVTAIAFFMLLYLLSLYKFLIHAYASFQKA